LPEKRRERRRREGRRGGSAAAEGEEGAVAGEGGVVLGESLQLQLASFRVGVRRNTIAGNTEGVSSYLFEGARKRTECHLVLDLLEYK
jgi:hypothetical protein